MNNEIAQIVMGAVGGGTLVSMVKVFAPLGRWFRRQPECQNIAKEIGFLWKRFVKAIPVRVTFEFRQPPQR